MIREKKKWNPSSYIKTSYSNLNEIIYGFEKNNLYVLGARPGMGKTTFALNFIHDFVTNNDLNVMIVSFEMNELQILSKLLSIETNIPTEKILYENDYEGIEKVNIAYADLLTKKLHLECPHNMDFKMLRNTVIEKHKASSLDFLFVDDIQRISIAREERQFASNREQEVSSNVRGLKSLARELNIPILANSQLNRDVKDRPTHVPCLTDFRDSGSIEGDSDVILLFHRPEYFGILEDENGMSLINVSEINIAKNRHGKQGKITLEYANNCNKYFEPKPIDIGASTTPSKLLGSPFEKQDDKPF